MVELATEAQAVGALLRRELLRFARSPARLAAGFVQPILFLVMLGAGLEPLLATNAVDFRKFVFPGVIAMAVVATAVFNSASIVWDREFGLLRATLVAPVSRTAIIVGKALGSAIAATVQGSLMLLLAPLLDVQLTPGIVAAFVGATFLVAFSVAVAATYAACRMRRLENFQLAVQFLLFPLIFLSGAVFPLASLPTWLTVLTHANPLTYAMDALRRILLQAEPIDAATRVQYDASLALFGQPLSVGRELALVAVLAAILLVMASSAFRRME